MDQSMQADRTKQTTQAYDEIAPYFAAKFCGTDLSTQLDRFCASLQHGARVVDVGCGPGRDLLSLMDRGFWAVGLDRSAGMLRQAMDRGAKLLVQADARALPFANGALDGIWACASLLHLPKAELPAALAEIHRVLGHGHVCLILKQGKGENWREDDNRQQRFFAYYHPAEVELALERAGFHVIYCGLEPDSHRPNLNWINAIGWTKLITPQVGANVAIFNGAGQVLLTRRQDNGLWCLPGGHMDLGETLDQTAMREAQEETGLAIQLERLVGLYSSYFAPGTFGPNSPARAILVALFRAHATGGDLMLNAEVTEFGWFDPDHLPQDLIPQHVQRIHDAVRKTQSVVIA
jgi:8-oxo-dGTP pyrophosphatase MutT (NUDIX family)/ubiquinone/menaquinone biosynthesis C-methylase UbiE